MSDIVAFLAGRLDEEADLSRGTTGGSWYAPEIPLLLHGYPRWRVDIVTGERESPRGIADCLISDADARHIAYWDPPRILAEIAAKREMIRVVEAATVARDAAEGTVLAGATKLTVRAYTKMLRLLAQPYSGHPDSGPARRLP